MNPRRFSFILLAATLVLTGWQHMSTLLLTVLFSLFVIRKLHFTKSRWPAVGLFVVALFLLRLWRRPVPQGGEVVTMPAIAEQAVPSVITFAETHGINLPFDDYESLKSLTVIAAVKEQSQNVNSAASNAGALAACDAGVNACSSPAWSWPRACSSAARCDLDRDRHAVRRNLYTVVGDEVAA